MFRLLKKSNANANKSFVGLLTGMLVFVAILFFTDLEPGKPEITRTFAVAMLMAIWWVTEALPLPVTALVPIVAFPMLGVIDGKTVSAAYMNHIIFYLSVVLLWRWLWNAGTFTNE
jgi:solute carrier family 13 (sodium-dependent dicarboxylate transporter), member 2/3/5